MPQPLSSRKPPVAIGVALASLALVPSTAAAQATCTAISVTAVPTALVTGGSFTSYANNPGPTMFFDASPDGNSCSTVDTTAPGITQRGFTGVGTDAVFTFDRAVSSVYVYTQHVQNPGDELVIAQAGTITPVSCSGYYRIDFTTPSATLTVRDLSPDGGSGYSIMLANCTENKPTSAPGVEILNANDGINAAEMAAGIDVTITLPPEAKAGDTLYIDTDNNGQPDHTIVLTAAQITAGTVTVDVDPADVPTGGNWTVTAAVQNASGLSPIGQDNAKVDGIVPGAPVVVFADGDGYVTMAEVQAGVDVVITLPAGTVPGDDLHIDLDGDGTADMVIDVSSSDVNNGFVTIKYQSRTTTSYAEITVTAVLVDAFGNVGPTGSDTTILDEQPTPPPVVTIEDGGDGVLQVNEQGNGVDVTVGLPTGAAAGDTLYVEYNGVDGWELEVTLTDAMIAAGEYVFTIAQPNIPDGSLTVSAQIEDPVGNVSEPGTDTTVIECVASAEVCDLRDNDCDGVRDGSIGDDGVLVSSCADFDNDGLSDWTETYGPTPTDPTNPDTDGDGLQDGTESGLTEPESPKTDLAIFVPDLDPASTTDPNDDDSDDDGLVDGTEDADQDGALDPEETDPNAIDSDDDGIQDGTESGLATPEGDDTDATVFVPDADPETVTDPLIDDTDEGTVHEGLEDANHNGKYEPDLGECDPLDETDDLFCVDTDGDGLSDGFEETNGTDPDDDDSDDDGLGDGTETNGGTTSPTNPDTDGDGLQDGTETGLTEPEGEDTGAGFVPDVDPETTTSATNPDTDGDGLQDGEEDANLDGAVDATETDPNDPDTDDGGVNDGDEVANGTDPLDGDDDMPDTDVETPEQWVQGGCACDTSGSVPWILLSLVAGLVVRRRVSEVR